MTKEIPLTQGKVALVDDDDFEELSKHKWYPNTRGYAWANIRGKNTLMHRLLMGDIGKRQVDHINGNKLDNRKSNIRPCTQSENNANTGKNKKNTSGYRGVIYRKDICLWRAYLGLNGERISLGHYETPQAAARAYYAAARVAFGEFARPNFED